MLYYLAQILMPHIGATRVFTYHTVRAGGAAITGFLFCLLVGPWIIRRLQRLKIGQHIKKEHVADLHALHKGKAGTPTMGGTMIILSTVLTLAVWGRWSNRLLWVSLAVFVLLGAVGFLDDLIKLKRKHNDGLSARAKLTGQIIAGLLLGFYVIQNPVTVSTHRVRERDILDWQGLVRTLASTDHTQNQALQEKLWAGFDPEMKYHLSELAGKPALIPAARKQAVLAALNKAIEEPELYETRLWPPGAPSREAQALLEDGLDTLSIRERLRLNRLLIEAALPGIVAQSVPGLHTKVGIPGFKNAFIALGPFYVLFVILIIVSVSNAVNITDGLDGLAVGAAVISIMTYAAIAYAVSRADWSAYLYLAYVPEASELFVFGAALLGTGLGFLWFNAHPAEVFMGDTGSLALGGAIATMAILTKQELLLLTVAGLFVIEAASVMIQVASYKLTGKRVFRMAPLHHHFELLGWAESKVTMRFWIIAILFALMSLGTLKLR